MKKGSHATPWQFRSWGSKYREPVLFLHGFTWDGSLWGPVAEAMAGSGASPPGGPIRAATSGAFRLVAVDLPGHGDTGWPRDASFFSVARGVAALLPGRPTLVGYSLGARLALQAALLAPGAFRALVLVSGTAGIEDAAERSRRAVDDAALAADLRTHGIEAFVDRWERHPVFGSGARLPEGRRKLLRGVRLAQDPASLAHALEVLGQGQMAPLWDQLGSLRIPTLVVAGSEDPKYEALATRMATCIPGSTVSVVQDCGHTVPLEASDALADTITRFIAALAPLTPFRSG